MSSWSSAHHNHQEGFLKYRLMSSVPIVSDSVSNSRMRISNKFSGDSITPDWGNHILRTARSHPLPRDGQSTDFLTCSLLLLQFLIYLGTGLAFRVAFPDQVRPWFTYSGNWFMLKLLFLEIPNNRSHISSELGHWILLRRKKKSLHALDLNSFAGPPIVRAIHVYCCKLQPLSPLPPSRLCADFCVLYFLSRYSLNTTWFILSGKVWTSQ